MLIYFQIDFKQNNVMLIPIKPELLALAFIFNKIKRGARFLRLLQVCVRKHIPQLLLIIYYNGKKYAIDQIEFFNIVIRENKSG